MRFLFTTIQFDESGFYGRVASDLEKRGHSAAHASISRLAARRLGRRQPAACLPDVMREVGTGPSLQAEVDRIESQYRLPSLRDAWWPDPACRGRPEGWCVERTVRTFRAVERIFDGSQPDVVVPEVGRETMRTAAYLVGLDRGATVLFLFYTIFPNPLMLYADRYAGQIVPARDIRPLGPAELAEVDAWIDRFTSETDPILTHRVARVTPGKLRDFARHVAVKALLERDNEYLFPHRYVTNTVIQRTRGLRLRRVYREADAHRPFVYFPLHVTDDFKIERVIPHCVDQAYLVQQVADALPQGYDLVLKEHPWSIGRNSLGWLRRVLRLPNVRLVDPYVSSHELMRRSAAVAVISSTVGLEALLYEKPVLTLGQPYYAGYGLTVDVDSFRELRSAVPAVLGFRPDREAVRRFLGAAMKATYPGAPQGVDPSPENAATVAASLDQAVGDLVRGRAAGAAA